MRHNLIRVCLLSLSTYLLNLQVQAQDAQVTLLQTVQTAVKQAATEHVDELAPETYAQAIKQLHKAEQELAAGKKPAQIQKSLTKSQQLLDTARQLADTSRKELATVLKTRDDAHTAQAEQFAVEAWNTGITRLQQAIERIEHTDITAAQRKGAEAEVLLRTAELLAIKTAIVGEARNLIATAEKDKVAEYAPRSLALAHQAVQRAEELLDHSRYDTSEPRTLAAQAIYEVQHAHYLATQISQLQSKPGIQQHLLELFLLDWETQLKQLAAEFNTEAKFTQGYAAPLQRLLEKAQQQQKTINTLQQDGNDLKAQIALLNDEIKKLTNRLGGESEERLALQKRLSAQERQRTDITTLENMFTTDEARVYRQNNDIIMTLIGLTFDVGKSNIDAAASPLLTKVYAAAKLFPNATISVEGHTDAEGTESANLLLSQDRADAVRQYLVLTLGMNPEKVSSIGYGESRPLTSNDTEQGRNKNRRIDIVLHLGNLSL